MEVSMPVENIKTDRLILRALDLNDSRSIMQYAQRDEIAHTVYSVPMPYFPLAIEGWILMARAQYYLQNIHRFYALAICQNQNNKMIGTITLAKHCEDSNKQEYYVLEYWIAKPYTDTDYALEAIRAFLTYINKRWGIQDVSTYLFKDSLVLMNQLKQLNFRLINECVQKFHFLTNQPIFLREMLCK